MKMSRPLKETHHNQKQSEIWNICLPSDLATTATTTHHS